MPNVNTVATSNWQLRSVESVKAIECPFMSVSATARVAPEGRVVGVITTQAWFPQFFVACAKRFRRGRALFRRWSPFGSDCIRVGFNSCFDAFFSREPVLTSLENAPALTTLGRRGRYAAFRSAATSRASRSGAGMARMRHRAVRRMAAKPARNTTTLLAMP